MKTLYKVTFPNNSFYIGTTQRSLRDRLLSHTKGSGEPKYKQDIFNSFNLTLDELCNITTVLYTGWDAEYYESLLIFTLKDNPQLINKRITKKRPHLNNWLRSNTGKKALEKLIDSMIRNKVRSSDRRFKLILAKFPEIAKKELFK